MGLRHVLEHYLRGLRVGPASLGGLPDLDGDLRDMQFESAWRMCEWDPALAVRRLRLLGPQRVVSCSCYGRSLV